MAERPAGQGGCYAQGRDSVACLVQSSDCACDVVKAVEPSDRQSFLQVESIQPNTMPPLQSLDRAMRPILAVFAVGCQPSTRVPWNDSPQATAAVRSYL